MAYNHIKINAVAVLVIDIQKDIASPDGVLGKHGRDLTMVPAMLEKVQLLIQKGQAYKIPIFYLKHVFDKSKLTALQAKQFCRNENKLCNIETDGHTYYKIKPDLKNTFNKYNYNAFSNEHLKRKLEENNIETLVIVGMDTHICVETTVRAGYDLGYEIIVPRDAVACNAKHINFHENSLKVIHKYFGTVTSAAEVIELWDQQNR